MSDDFAEKVFERIVTDYGRTVLKTVKMPCNSRLVSETLKDCLAKGDDVEQAARRLVRKLGI